MIHILVSACLLGENCKWDGGNNRNEALLALLKEREEEVALHPVCPEVDGGLSTPRPASEIRQSDEAVINTAGDDVTAEFLMGADLALRRAKAHGCRLAILKERSPSCGSREIYDGTFSHKRISGKGKTAALLSAADIRVFGETELAAIREELQRELGENR